MTVRIYRPDGDVDGTVTQLAGSVPSLRGRRVVVLDNGKPNAAYVMTRAAETLAARTGATLQLVVKKGPGGRSANAAVPCAPDVFERVRAEADVVITGAADCGSCTAYSVHDTVELERCGIPTVLVTTTRFRPVVAALASATGLRDIRALVLEHPIGGTDRDALRERADRAYDELVTLLTGTAPAADAAAADPAPTTPATTRDNELMAALGVLVAADGAGFEMVAFDEAAARLRLRLVIPDADCADCVMPRAALETLAVTRLAAQGVRTVVIDDPREAER
jgi:hypothetical protein